MNDRPQTNTEIRLWYHEQLAEIPELNKQWIKENVSLEERAERSWRVRRDARLRAREMMMDAESLAEARESDKAVYGSPDGPSFEFLIERLHNKGLAGNAVYEAIIKSASRSNAEVDKLLGLN